MQGNGNGARLHETDGCAQSGADDGTSAGQPSAISNGDSSGNASWWGDYDPRAGAQQGSERAVSMPRHCVQPAKQVSRFQPRVSSRRLHVPAAPKPWLKRPTGMPR
jgi:hypothetical protein